MFDQPTTIQKKVCMLGDFAVGKTSLVRRFVEGKFDDKYLSTIGVKISRKPVSLAAGGTLNLLIWDLAGGDKFNGVQTNYLKGASGAILVCDLTRKGTLAKLHEYTLRLAEVLGEIPLVVLGNKNDLEAEREISRDDLAAAVNTFAPAGTPHFFTSAKTGDHVETAFQTLGERLSQKS
jgi:small GTP-binding protein